MECKFCKVETDKYFVFGLIERKIIHRGAFEQQKYYSALALLRVPCCDTCAANLKRIYQVKNLMYALGCVAGAFFSFLIGLKVLNSNDFVAMFFGIIMLCFAVGAVSCFMKCYKGRNFIAEKCLSSYVKEGVVEKGDIIVNSTSERISIRPVNGSSTILNSVTVDYHCFSSEHIEKFRKPANLSSTWISQKRVAMSVLKDWYDAST